MAISTAGYRGVLGRSSTDGALVFLTLFFFDATELRFVNNPVDIMHGGDNYTAYPFEITLGTDTDQSPGAEIRIANIDRTLWQTIENQVPQAYFGINIEVCMISTPDTTEKIWSWLQCTELSADAMWIVGRFSMERMSTEPFPKQRATRTRCPSLFRRV